MGLQEGEQITKTPPIPSLSVDAFVATHLQQISDENKSADILSQNDSPARDDYFAFVTRATNDAVRDWDVKSGALSWPQGLQSLLGYENSSAECNNIGFWQKNLYPGDRLRVGSSIHDALIGPA